MTKLCPNCGSTCVAYSATTTDHCSLCGTKYKIVSELNLYEIPKEQKKMRMQKPIQLSKDGGFINNDKLIETHALRLAKENPDAKEHVINRMAVSAAEKDPAWVKEGDIRNKHEEQAIQNRFIEEAIKLSAEIHGISLASGPDYSERYLRALTLAEQECPSTFGHEPTSEASGNDRLIESYAIQLSKEFPNRKPHTINRDAVRTAQKDSRWVPEA